MIVKEIITRNGVTVRIADDAYRTVSETELRRRRVAANSRILETAANAVLTRSQSEASA